MSVEFTRISQAVSASIQKFSYNTAQIQQYVAKIGTPQDSDQVRTELHRVTHTTEELAQQITEQLKELGQLVNSSAPTDQRDRRTQAERLRDQFLAALTRFQQQQRDIIDREKQSINRARSSSGQNPYDLGDDDGWPQSRQQGVPKAVVNSGGQQQLTQYETAVDLEAIQERERALRGLEADVVNVNQIFKDLAMLVHEQGATIDTIEANIETTQTRVQEGTAELRQAVKYASAARKKKLICVLILIAVLAVIGLIIGLAVGLKS